jgi:hypothetical protein
VFHPQEIIGNCPNMSHPIILRYKEVISVMKKEKAEKWEEPQVIAYGEKHNLTFEPQCQSSFECGLFSRVCGSNYVSCDPYSRTRGI